MSSLDDLRVSYLTTTEGRVRYINQTAIEFDFPKFIFIERDVVRVSLRFGEEKYFQGNETIFVYTPITLEKLRP